MLPTFTSDANLLVGLDTSDDAGVYRLNDSTALIQTLDFFTPVVDNPYDFGTYRGRNNSPTLLTELETHAPEFVYNPDTDSWYITTAGWQWVATLTSGEVAVAPLEWQKNP